MRASINSDTTSWNILSTTLLVSTWLYLHSSSLQWLWQSLQQASSFNLILICLVIVGLLIQGVRSRRQLQISTAPTMRFLPLLVMLGAAVSAIALQWLVDVEQITVILFALGTYGLCGLFLQPAIWRKGLPVATLIAFILPFCFQFGTGLGFPVRVLTARVVEQMLSVWQIAAISSYDIIVLENGIAHVDLPCSGLRSLWTGTLFLLAVTWLENRQLGIRWLLVCGFSLFLLIVSNIVRVLILVLITQLQQPTFAQILHIPLGLLGFICACGLTWLMLQRVPKHQLPKSQQQDRKTEKTPLSIHHTSFKTQTLLVVVLIALALIPPFHHRQQELLAITSLPSGLESQRVALTEAEQRFFDNATATVSEKWRFTSGELSGSILLVSSSSWSSYHAPELCFVGSGLKVDRTERKWLTPNVIARWLSLQDGKLSATYWFQSPQQTTDDFLSRLWSQVTRRQKNWAMVSVLFDSAKNPDSSEIRTFATTIHNFINRSLNGEQR